MKGAATCTYVHTLLHTPPSTETMSTPSASILRSFTRSINTTTLHRPHHPHTHMHTYTPPPSPLTFLTEPNCSSWTKEVSQFQEVLGQDQQEEEKGEGRGGEERGGEGRRGEES